MLPSGSEAIEPGRRSWWRRTLRFLVVVVAALVLAFLAYALAALASALLPLPGRVQQADGEPPVYLCASLAHTDIAMPGRDPLADWGSLLPAVASPGLPPQAYLAFGWGDLRFFRETPTWGDVRISTALGALAGQHDTALRVVAINPPEHDPSCLRLRIDRAGRQALIDHIKATLLLDAAGQPHLQPDGTQFQAYYLAKGRYSALRTCNQWAAEALGAAGLPHAFFAPFSFSVTWPVAASRGD
ncbi:DUF2459 domain-containing protein [Labrys okinawensis]|uniref:DUF2459 domain-containing protein n=1 Tax=Labrys okinawensis TaxID=346911 RepID=UPI0039BD390D